MCAKELAPLQFHFKFKPTQSQHLQHLNISNINSNINSNFNQFPNFNKNRKNLHPCEARDERITNLTSFHVFVEQFSHILKKKYIKWKERENPSSKPLERRGGEGNEKETWSHSILCLPNTKTRFYICGGRHSAGFGATARSILPQTTKNQ